LTAQTPSRSGPAPLSASALRANRLAVRAARPLLRPRRAPAAGSSPQVTFLLLNGYGMSGAIRAAFNLAGQLALRHEVEVVSITRSRRRPFLPVPPGVRVTSVENPQAPAQGGWRGLLRRVLSRFDSLLLHPEEQRYVGGRLTLWTDVLLVRRLRRIGAGALITNRPSLNLLGAQLARPGIAVFAQEQRDLSVRSQEIRERMRSGYSGLEALAVLTDRDRAAYDALLGGATRVVTIPNAVTELPGPRSDLSRPIVVAAGRLTRQKGFDYLIPAFARVAPRAPGWRLRICGDGPLRHQLSGLVAAHDSADRIELLGQVRDIASELQQASIFVLSSRSEGFPLVLLEAMSKGLPVVSFDCPTGPAEIVDQGRTGFLVPLGDTDAMVEAILELIHDEPKRRRFGAAAGQRAEEYSLARIGARWEELMADALGEASAQPAVDQRDGHAVRPGDGGRTAQRSLLSVAARSRARSIRRRNVSS
jgi:glycosyltransferase involved in cell wall biosynthesis